LTKYKYRAILSFSKIYVCLQLLLWIKKIIKLLVPESRTLRQWSYSY